MNRKQQQAEETRARILAAAEECFARYGYDATGVAEICASAGLSKGAFYHHFASKQEVFLALLQRWVGATDAQMAALRNEAASVPESLIAMAGMVGEILRTASDKLPIYLEFWSKAARDEQVWRGTVEPLHRFRDFFAAMVEAGTAEGSLRPVDPQVAAWAILALGAGLLMAGLLDPQGADWQQVSQQAIQLLLEGLNKR